MSETIEFIEAYFEKKLSKADQAIFEERCLRDQAFATEVAFYITSREAVRQKLLQQKLPLWQQDRYDAGDTFLKTIAPVKKLGFLKWLPYAAACLLILIAVYFFPRTEKPHQLANSYIKQTLTRISQTMDGSKDSLQKGISYYNNAQYDSALHLFEPFYQAHPDNSEAKEYIGRAYLMKKDYDKAITNFGELANKKLFSNPGLFFKAVTLLERNLKGDKEAAKELLEQVKDKQLEGKKEASEWLGKW